MIKVSVIIPCRNEAKNIEETIQAIYNNSICKKEKIEIIIVDGQSDDGTIDVLQSIKHRYSDLIIIENPQKITPVAFNLGIQKASGEYIQIVGARQVISENYLEDAIHFLEKNKNVWCVGGKVINVFTNEISETITKAMNSSFGVGLQNFRIAKKSIFVDTVGTPMYPKYVFNKIGLFDEALVRNQDDEFNYRVTKAGGRIYLLADITIKYIVRAAYNKLYKQYFQYGFWKVYVNKKHKTITTIRQLIPAFFVSSIIIGFILSFLNSFFLLILISGLVLYLLLAIYSAQKNAKNLKEVILIIYSYFLLHFGYGFGYIKGVITFLIFNKQASSGMKQLSR